MSGHPSPTHPHPITIAEIHAQNSPDAHPTSIHAQSEPLPSHPQNPRPHFTAGNSFGPYLFRGLTTNHPHPQFLDGICNPCNFSLCDPALVKLDVPSYLFANRSHIRELPCSNARVDTLHYYLCASLARHYAYRKAYLKKGITPFYRTSYLSFKRRFTEALESLLNNETKTAKEQNDLVSVEQDLTHESFNIWPQLFDRTFTANTALLSATDAMAPTLLNVLALREHPLPFLHSLNSNLETDWINLADAADVLDRHHPRYTTWCMLEQRKGEVRERFSSWIEMVQEAMDAFDEEAKDSTWQTQVDRLRDIGVSMVGEPVRVWDDVVDGMGFTGWKRGLATRLEEGRGRGEGVMGERGGVGREWEWVPRGLRPRAPGVENLRPVER